MFLAKKNETLPSKGKFVSVRFAELAQNESFTASLDRAGRHIRHWPDQTSEVSNQ